MEWCVPRITIVHALFTQNILLYSRPALLAGLHIMVLLIHGKIVEAIFVHHGIGLLLFHGCSCAGARSSTQQPASATCLSSYLGIADAK
jgi:hypothetical protein